MTTTNLYDFGTRELLILEETIRAMREQGLPCDFDEDGIVPMLNQSSGNVFLTNSDYQVAMLNGDTLESFYFLSYYGNEGFLDDLIYEYENGYIKIEDFEQFADICEINGKTELAEEIRQKLENEVF